MRTTSALLAVIGSLLATAASAQVPQWTVPNTLVNGQVADATDVMENFNAVADCVESARGDTVTHDGTPTTGQVAVFASPTGITGGNLTGDITTSGSTAVDAKGRVTSAFSGPIGGGSGILAFTTLFYQSAYTLPAGTSTILNVTNANEVMVIGHNITKSVTGAINVQFSVDGGATYVSTNVYLLDISTAGAVGTNPTSIGLTDVTTSARSFYLHVPNLRSSTPKFFLCSRAGIFPVPSPITHIRVYSTAGNVTGGSLTVLAR
jgi:hypothetical protein